MGAFFCDLSKVFETPIYPVLFSIMKFDGIIDIASKSCEAYLFSIVHLHENAYAWICMKMKDLYKMLRIVL